MITNGIDLVEISRFENLNPKIFARFVERVFTLNERNICEGSFHRLAGRFAAKEAVAKALKTGIGEVHWKDIEILQGDQGEPLLILHNRALEISTQLGFQQWSLSISHGKEIAIASFTAITG